MKKLWIYTSTTGFDPYVNDLYDLSLIYEDEEINFKIRPINIDNITESSLEHNKITKEELLNFEPANIVFKKIDAWLASKVGRFDKTDKFIPISYNADFHISFLKSFFVKNNAKHFNTYIDLNRLIDVKSLVNFYNVYKEMVYLKKTIV